MLLRYFLIALIGGLLTGCGKLIQPNINDNPMTIRSGQYQLDPTHTAVLFKVNHLGFSKFIGRFEEISATLHYDPANAELASLDATVNMASVNVNNPKFERALRNRFWFHTDQYPQARFTTLSVTKVGNNALDMQGELRFLGRTQPLTMHIIINGAGTNLTNGKYTMGFSASATLLRSDFGLSLLTPAIGDEVELEIHAEFVK